MKVPFHDLKKQYKALKTEIDQAIALVCAETAFSGGHYVELFEADFAKHYSFPAVAGVNSGTSALHLALLTLDIKAGDEVIIPANTFIATAWAVAYVNATPIFVDCREDTWQIDIEDVKRKITPKTKAFIGVHLYGQPFDLGPLQQLAQEHQLPLVEDCAQAHGARYKGKYVGGLGELGCFSFYPGKNLGAYGEGGAVASNRLDHIERIKKLRNHGSSERYHHDEIGYNMRMDGIQAAILSVKLKYIDDWNKRRQAIARQYQSGIKNPKVQLQSQPDWAESVYHLFVVTTEDRTAFIEHSKKAGVATALHYPIPCHLQKAFAHLGYQQGSLPKAEYLAEHCVSLPMYPELTDEEASWVIETINKY
ncbi:MAG: DegT/DnrJ/EryC1/StrS family aminotransferase [Candidatus Margulisbacteria bacterium]|nr:DegT/DnrJ/EryC1/StrS family aminotransferase [Candidatus Margulisiibacteriota bacterium]